MSPNLRLKINNLIALDNQRRLPNGVQSGLPMTLGSFESDALLGHILDDVKSPIISALEALSRDELAYVMALMWFGRGDGIAERGATFESVLAFAETSLNEGSVFYVGEKPLGEYLPRGLARLKVGEADPNPWPESPDP
jgi:hypothetical protein